MSNTLPFAKDLLIMSKARIPQIEQNRIDRAFKILNSCIELAVKRGECTLNIMENGYSIDDLFNSISCSVPSWKNYFTWDGTTEIVVRGPVWVAIEEQLKISGIKYKLTAERRAIYDPQGINMCLSLDWSNG